MLDEVGRRASARALLTDTLPYEVPVIFSNDKLFSGLVSPNTTASLPAQRLIDRIRKLGAEVTKPYAYSIIKDGQRCTTLGIIHPTGQMRMASFYESFSSSLLASCAHGEFSLRRPTGPTPLFSESEINGEDTFRLGIPHLDPSEGEIDVSHVVSYFTYGKYNLLGKFVESEEFRRLEKRFKYLKTGDVTRCFASIYTHSVSWAVKGKEFSKANRMAFSFEAKFDELMQSVNYGETNGIVIGPEASRIFAEIILQDVDRKVQAKLQPLLNNRDYAIRRYVDDYFIFTNSMDAAEIIAALIERELEYYKLYPNRTKDKVAVRPFVSGISLARSEISDVIACLYDLADEVVEADDAGVIAGKAKALRARADIMRQACSKHNVDLHVVSGWLLTNLRNVLAKLARKASSIGREKANAMYLCIASVLDLIFYVCAVDLRVRTTYALCQCLSVIAEMTCPAGSDISDRIEHLISEEMAVLLRNAMALQSEDVPGIELANLLISGYHYVGSAFIRSEAAQDALQLMVNHPGFSYFRYITVKFCTHKEAACQAILSTANDKALALIGNGAAKIETDAEAYLTFVDLISAPDLSKKAKRKIIKGAIGGNPTDTVIEEVSPALGFVDWEGVSIKHTLERKALRPAYSWT